MKYIITLFLISLLFCGCVADQNNPDYTVHPDRLLNLNRVSLDEFDTRMANNNYHLADRKLTGYTSKYFYDYNGNDTKKGIYYSVIKVVNEINENKLVLFMKGGNDNYKDLKEKINDMGYKFFREEAYIGQPTFVYMKDIEDQLFKISPARSKNDLTIIRAIFFRREPFELN